MAFDTQIGTATVYLEASQEPPEGKSAVAHVLVNRVKDGRWGASITSVCLARMQFSCWNTDAGDARDRDRLGKVSDSDPVLVACGAVLQLALDGNVDPTGGATHYFAETIAPPAWVQGATFCGKFGSQLFYRNVA